MSDNSRILAAFAVLAILFVAYLFLNNPSASTSDGSTSTPSPTAAILSPGPGQATLSLGDSTVLMSSARSDDGTTDTVSLTNAGTDPLTVAVFTITPKEDAASASELELSGNYFVLEDDPVTVQTGTVFPSRTAEFTVTQSRTSQYGKIQLLVKYDDWQGADRAALTEFIRSLNAKVPALKYDDARLLSYDLNYRLNDKSVAVLKDRVKNAGLLLEQRLPALQSSGSIAASATETLYSSSSGEVLASVDPLSGLAYFKAPVSFFGQLQSLQTLPVAEFFTQSGSVPVTYSLCGGELCILVDVSKTRQFTGALGKSSDWSGEIRFQAPLSPNEKIPNVQLIMVEAPGYALYSPKIVVAGNKGQPVFAINNLPYAVSGGSVTIAKNRVIYVGTLESAHPLANEPWFDTSSFVDLGAQSGLEGHAFPVSFSTPDFMVSPSACLHRLCTCNQLRQGLAGDLYASQTPAQTYFAFFDALRSDANAKALLKKARVQNPQIALLIRGQNLGPSCSVGGQLLDQKTSVLTLTYNLDYAVVQYSTQTVPGLDDDQAGWQLYSSRGPLGYESAPEDYSAALARLDAGDDFSDFTEGQAS